MALEFQTFSLPLAAGMNTKADPRALEAPAMAVARDVQFDEHGGLQTRYPYAGLTGGGLTDLRRIVANGDELIAFTKDALKTFDSAGASWRTRATYLAPKVTERPVFVSNSEQRACDRAESGGVTLYAWEETAGSTTLVKVASVDSATGTTILAPVALNDGATSMRSRPRIVVLGGRFLVFGLTSPGDLYVAAVDDDSTTRLNDGPFTSVLTAMDEYYDVTVASPSGGDDVAYVAARRTTTTSYDLASVTSVPAVTATTVARDCDGPIAISATPSGLRLQIVRADGTDIVGDYITTGFVDVYTNQAIGTAAGTVNQIAAAHRSETNGGQYRCHAFWSSEEDDNASDWTSSTNWVDTGGTLGTAADFVRRLGVASRAFDHDGAVYVWLVFAGQSSFSGADASNYRAQLQSTYFLYRDDGELIAKSAMHRSGGFSHRTGHLPNVQSLGGNVYAWCGVERRVVQVGEKQRSYGGRAPREIVVEFDSDDARRCVRLGETLYIVGGEVRQWDGRTLAEVGFHIYPWDFGAIELASAGLVADGTYALKLTWRWDNARAERDRSTTATVGTIEITAGPNSIQIPSCAPLQVTHKREPEIAVEVWRTTVNPTTEAPFYLATGQDPSDTTGANCYVENEPESASVNAFEDALADASIASRESNPENAGVLEALAPPAASIIAANQDRLFLAGVAGDPHRVWYSRLRGDGEVASFHDALTIDIPPAGGAITALAFLDETLIVFRETAIYAVAGDGFDNLGGGQNYGPPRRLSADVGAASAEAVAVVPQGLLCKSRKGWYLVGRGGNVEYVGGPVAAFDADEVVGVQVVESQHQARCVTDERVLVWDYLVGQWAEWTIAGAVSSAMWLGSHMVATEDGDVLEQGATHTGLDYGLDVETAWIPMRQIQGYGKVLWFMALGEYRSAHDLRVRIAYNYEESDASGPTWVDDLYWSPNATVVGGPLQVRTGPSRGLCQAIKVRLTAYADGSTTTPPAGEALRLTALAFEIGVERGLNRRMTSAQKQ